MILMKWQYLIMTIPCNTMLRNINKHNLYIKLWAAYIWYYRFFFFLKKGWCLWSLNLCRSCLVISVIFIIHLWHEFLVLFFIRYHCKTRKKNQWLKRHQNSCISRMLLGYHKEMMEWIEPWIQGTSKNNKEFFKHGLYCRNCMIHMNVTNCQDPSPYLCGPDT